MRVWRATDNRYRVSSTAMRGLGRLRVGDAFRAWAGLPAACRHVFLFGIVLVVTLGAAAQFTSNPATKTLLDNTHWTIGYILAAVITWLGLPPKKSLIRGGRPLLAPLALTGNAVGQILWDIQVAAGWNPFPAPSDAFFLTLGIGLSLSLAMILKRQFGGTLRLTVLLDALALTTIAIVVGLLIYVPQQGTNSAFQMAVLVGYPFGLLTATALAATILRHLELESRWGWGSYVVALFVTGLLWLQWNYLTLIGGLQSGTLYNLSFSVTTLWLGLSVVAVQRSEAEGMAGGRRSDTVTRIVPLFVSAGSVMLALLLLLDDATDAFARGVIVTGALAIIVVEVLSQQLLLRERSRLFRALLDAHGDLEQAVRALELRNHEYARALENTEAANRAKSMFLANMSHELRTPLNAVIGFSEVMHLDAERLPPAVQHYPASIAEAGHQLLAVIEGILAISQTDLDAIDAVIEPVLLGQAVGWALEGLQVAAADKQISLVVDVPSGQVVAADRRLLRQALIHLLGNAVKYTPRDGRIMVSTDVADSWIVLHIADNGPGMSEEEHGTAFEPFARSGAATISHSGGLGIGLALSRRFIELQDGTLSIRRAHPTGTEVLISLPRILA